MNMPKTTTSTKVQANITEEFTQNNALQLQDDEATALNQEQAGNIEEEISGIRSEIESIDDQIQELHQARTKAVSELLEYKLDQGKAIFQPNQEQMKVEHLEDQLNQIGVSDLEMRVQKTNLMRRIAASREMQYEELYRRYAKAYLPEGEEADNPFLTLLNGVDAKPEAKKLRAYILENYAFPVAFEIAEGMRKETYSAQRVSVHADLGIGSEQIARNIWPESHIHKEHQVTEVLSDVADGKVDIGLLTVREGQYLSPQDLTDSLSKYGLHIADRFTVTRRYQLMHHPDTCVSDVRKVLSESHLLEAIMPQIRRLGWQMRAVVSTEEAARELLVHEDNTTAVFLSEAEGETFGLVSDPQWEMFNVDLELVFIVVTKDLIIAPDADRVLVGFTLSNQTGDLAAALQAVADYGFNIVEVSSKEVSGKPYQQRVVMEFTASPTDEGTFPLLYQMTQESLDSEIIAWFRDKRLD